MTDARVAGAARETIFATPASISLAGVVIETLVFDPTATKLATVVREVLMEAPDLPAVGQTAVTVNST